ncbi:serine hydrolase domain-containing protein [Maribacter sp. 2210JD10-5]|uniref:serine hydrolase domain-containing protein n=1 Tax=Maribacter sp. 2210JD10-5 TaxID=3386272 RepID=UPI0039BD2398
MNSVLKYIKHLFSPLKETTVDNIKWKELLTADGLLQDLIDNEKIPGLAITVLKDGKKHFQKGYGYANLETKTLVHPQKTVFRIASVSKPVAATALAHMVVDGLIDLDTSFYEYVSYYPKKKWDFTIRQLASHTAGIRGYKGAEYGLSKPYSIKESINIFKDDALLFEPGTDYLYNSFDWVLISLAMQEVSGIPFEEYVQEKVLIPLGMKNTFAPEGYKKSFLAEREIYFSEFYSKGRLDFREAIPVNNYYKLAAGGYLSTSEDIAKFGQAYLNGEILNEKVLSPFLTSEKINGKPTHYGLGWQVSEDKQGRPYFGHIGNGVGGYSNFFVYPNEQMVFSILTNCTNPNIQEALDAVVDSFINNTSLS